MKLYIGVKVVKARPGTMAEAQALKCKCPVEDQERIFRKSGTENKDGYIVVYPDGYVSWSPKDVFEKAYQELDCKDFILSDE